MSTIYLSGTKRLPVLIDDDDFETVTNIKWYFHDGYAVGKLARQTVYMHRLIAKTPPGMSTDHINGNRLDNRKANLKICDHFTNMQNIHRKKPRGSIKKMRQGKHIYYYAEVRENGNRHLTTTCPTEEQARGALKQMLKYLNL